MSKYVCFRAYALRGDGVSVWLWGGRGFKIKRRSSFLFSDRYVHRKWHLLGEWWLVWVPAR